MKDQFSHLEDISPNLRQKQIMLPEPHYPISLIICCDRVTDYFSLTDESGSEAICLAIGRARGNRNIITLFGLIALKQCQSYRNVTRIFEFYILPHKLVHVLSKLFESKLQIS